MEYSNCVKLTPTSARPFIESLELGYTDQILNNMTSNFLMYYILDENQFKTLNVTIHDILRMATYKERNFFYTECIDISKSSESLDEDVNTDRSKSKSKSKLAVKKVKKAKKAGKSKSKNNNYL